MNKKLYLARSLALAFAMSCYVTSGFASHEIIEQFIDNNELACKFQMAIGSIEIAVDSSTTEDSRQHAHNCATRIVQKFSELEARDFFNYLIGFRLEYDLSPFEYRPYILSFYEISSKMNLSADFKGIIKGYKEAYEEEQYSEEQLNKIEQILRNHPHQLQFQLIDDALSLCRQKVYAMAQDEEAFMPTDFRRIIQLVDLRNKYPPVERKESPLLRLIYEAVAYAGLQERQPLIDTLKQMAQYKVPQAELHKFISRDTTTIYTLVKKYY